MVSARLLSLLLLVPGVPAVAQSSEASSAGNPAPDESWVSPGEVKAPQRNSAPDDASWEDFPGATSVPTGSATATLPKLPEVPPLIPLEDDAVPARRASPGPPPVPNRVSLLGARTMGAGGLAAGFSLGFPTLSARVAYGVLPHVDVVASVDSLYGMMNELRLGGRWRVLDGGPRWSVGLAVEGGHAFFLRPASVELKGARYLSGRRNWNVLPGLVASFQRQGTRAARLFLDVRYHLSLDTEPIQRTPLGGLPPSVVTGSAFPIRLGAEMPLSEKTSYSVTVGGDVRTRSEDAGFMPVFSVGIVTGL